MATPVMLSPGEIDLSRYATDDEIRDAGDFFDRRHLMGAAPAELPDEFADARGGVWLPSDHGNIKRTYYSILDHGPRAGTRGVVLHVNAGTYQGTLSWFKGGSRGVGAHIEIGAGYAAQLVPLERKCWHAVLANSFAVGLEHAGFGRSRTEWLGGGEKEIRLSAAITSWILHEFKLGGPRRHVNVFYHSDGGASWGGHACPGGTFPYDVWLRLCKQFYYEHWGRR